MKLVIILSCFLIILFFQRALPVWTAASYEKVRAILHQLLKLDKSVPILHQIFLCLPVQEWAQIENRWDADQTNPAAYQVQISREYYPFNITVILDTTCSSSHSPSAEPTWTGPRPPWPTPWPWRGCWGWRSTPTPWCGSAPWTGSEGSDSPFFDMKSQSTKHQKY